MAGKFIFFIFLTHANWICSNQNEIANTFPILEGDTIRLYCDEDITLDDLNHFKAFTDIKSVKTVIIDSCVAPSKGSYAEVFRALNIDSDAIRALYLVKPPASEGYINHDDGPDPRRPKSYHFSGLQLEELKILNQDTLAALAIDLEFLKDQNELISLTIDYCDIMGRFPNTTKLERVELSDVVLYGDFGACQGFKVLHLSKLHIFGERDEYRYRMLNDCKQLVELKLEHIEKAELKQDLLRELPRTLRNITVRYSELDDFPYDYSLFEDSNRNTYGAKDDESTLTYLDLSHNNLQSSHFISTYKALEVLDISHNDLEYGFYYLPKLTDIKLDHSNFEKYCVGRATVKDINEDYYKTVQLKHISLSNSGMRELCFDGIPLSHLGLLNLTHNNIAVLNYRQLYNVPGENFVVDLRYNPLEIVELSQEDYLLLKQNDPSVARWSKYRIITNARFPCNCTNAWFTRAVHEGLLSIEGATCDDGSPLQPRVSYAIEGCAAACEGTSGCSAASSLQKLMKNRDKIASVFTEQNSLWWLLGKGYDKFIGT